MQISRFNNPMFTKRTVTGVSSSRLNFGTDPREALARQKFTEGVNAFQNGNLAGSGKAFRASVELVRETRGPEAARQLDDQIQTRAGELIAKTRQV